MGKGVQAIIIGLVVGFLVAFGMSALESAAGEKSLQPVIVGVIFGAIAAYVAGNLAGNRKVAVATNAERDAALACQPPAGMAQVFVYRVGFFGSAAGLNVRVGGVDVAQLKSPRFACITVPAGPVALSAGFGGLAGPQNRQGELNLTLAAGECALVRAALAMGALRNSVNLVLERLDDPMKKKLRGMKMVKTAV